MAVGTATRRIGGVIYNRARTAEETQKYVEECLHSRHQQKIIREEFSNDILLSGDTIETTISIYRHLIDEALMCISNGRDEKTKDYYKGRIDAYRKETEFWSGILQKNRYTRGMHF